jgi:hypothetical protein
MATFPIPMAEFKGQTDKVTQIKLTSVLVAAKWGLPTVALGGEIPLEVQTLYVSDGSKVQIAVKNAEGQTVDTVSGQMYSNLFRMPYKVKADSSNTLYFEAELPDHKLKGKSGAVRVSLVKISDCKWFDEAGKEAKETQEDQVLTLKAKINGVPDGAEAFVSVFLKLRETGEKTVFEGSALVTAGAIALDWKAGLKESPHAIKDHTSLDKVGEEYYHPELVFKAACMGVTGESPAIPVVHALVLYYEAAPGVAGKFEGRKIGVIAPDGSREDKTIPADGKIEVKPTKPGVYRTDESDIAELLE